MSDEQRLVAEKYPDLYWKVWCENRQFDPKSCNLAYGCEYGMGMSHIIRSTWNSTLDRMSKANAFLPSECNEKLIGPISEDRHEAIFIAECSLIVAQWLYDTDGSSHWGTPDSWWGTYWCWYPKEHAQ